MIRMVGLQAAGCARPPAALLGHLTARALLELGQSRCADVAWALLTRLDRAVALIPSVKNSRETLKDAVNPHASSSLVYAASEEVIVKASASTEHPGGR